MRLVCSPTSPEALLQMQAGAYLAGMMIVKRNNVSDMKYQEEKHNAGRVVLSGSYLYVYACFTHIRRDAASRLKFYLVGNSNSKRNDWMSSLLMSETYVEMIFRSVMPQG